MDIVDVSVLLVPVSIKVYEPDIHSPVIECPGN